MGWPQNLEPLFVPKITTVLVVCPRFRPGIAGVKYRAFCRSRSRRVRATWPMSASAWGRLNAGTRDSVSTATPRGRATSADRLRSRVRPATSVHAGGPCPRGGHVHLRGAYRLRRRDRRGRTPHRSQAPTGNHLISALGRRPKACPGSPRGAANAALALALIVPEFERGVPADSSMASSVKLPAKIDRPARRSPLSEKSQFAVGSRRSSSSPPGRVAPPRKTS
jgi:hypothetical protein